LSGHSTSTRGSPFRAILLACFFLSGASGLVYEVVWLRLLTLTFGSTAFAVGAVLTAFMGGLALGSFLLGRVVDRVQNPLRVYGLLELGVGLYALLTPALAAGLVPLYQAVWQSFHPSFYAFSLMRFLIALTALLPPTVLMGGTLPALSRWYVQGKEAGQGAGLLYALNTWGAVAGTVASGFVLLPAIGVRATLLTAAGISLLVGLLVIALARWGTRAPGEQPSRPACTGRRVETAPSASPSRRATAVVLVALGLSGFVAMAYEVAWTRLLTLILGSSTYAFSLMLSAFLVGLALGSLFAARAVNRVERPLWALARIEIGVGLAVLIGEHLFSWLPALFLGLFRAVGDAPRLFLAGQFGLAFLVMVLPTLLLGAVFPLAVKAYARAGGVGRRVGDIYAANTAGTVLGAFAGGFLLLPGLGIQGTISAGIVINLAAGLLLLFVPPGGRTPFRTVAGAGAVLLIPVAVFSAPPWNPLVMTSGVYKDAPLYLSLYRTPGDAFSRLSDRYRLRFYREGVTATVAVVERPDLEDRRHLILSIDGKVDASTAADMSTQVLSGHLPLLVGERVEKVLVVGFASGVTVGSVLRHPVRAVTAVEIEPAVMEASAFFDEFNHQPLKDPRLRVVLDDARNYLQVTSETYDAIISEPSNPWMSGPSRLFTEEFFRAGRARLRPGGLFVQWLQLYGMTPDHVKTLVRTFQAVFPHLLIFETADADLLLLGSDGAITVDYGRLAGRMARPAVAEDLRRVGVSGPLDLLVRFRLGGREASTYAGPGPHNTDDNALIEFAAPRSLYAETISANLAEIQEASSGVWGYLTGLGQTPAGRAPLLWGLALRYLTTGEVGQAEALAQEGLAHTPSAEWQWLAGEVALQRGRGEEAARAWQESLTQNPTYPPALISLALLRHRQGDFQGAEAHFARLTPRDAAIPVVRYRRGINLYFSGAYRRAAEELEEVTALNTAGDDLTAYFLSDDPEGLRLVPYYLSLACERTGDSSRTAQAMEQFVRGLDEWRRELEARPADLSLLAGFRQRVAKGAFLDEEARLARLIGERVWGPMAHYYKGTTLFFLGYYQDAVSELQAALALLGNGGEGSLGHYYLGLAYAKLNDPDRARAHLRRFLDHLHPAMKYSPKAIDAVKYLDGGS